ncbi:SWIM zinc finger family protein [Fodinicola feengrottensis]|uniref:SWIM zinc finger family protein n=1 Tax=Fodinicola feengrottensis TaxID=435914 RepID=UPI002441D88F|nr:SWIM zinc finger family protein [Fodinicola feengrottensis]
MRRFGQTWWGKQWVYALEERAWLDRNRLPRGRTYARQNTVSGLTVGRGEVTALVQGRRALPYKVVIRVATFDHKDWERVVASISTQVGRLAALLDGELPAEVVKDIEDAGCDLLPGAGEIRPKCSCPDWADLCKHAAAVCYLVSDAVDADPFALLMLRGRSREEILAALRARRGREAKSSGPAGPTGVNARQAYARQGRPAGVASSAVAAIDTGPAGAAAAGSAVGKPGDGGVVICARGRRGFPCVGTRDRTGRWWAGGGNRGRPGAPGRRDAGQRRVAGVGQTHVAAAQDTGQMGDWVA